MGKEYPTLTALLGTICSECSLLLLSKCGFVTQSCLRFIALTMALHNVKVYCIFSACVFLYCSVSGLMLKEESGYQILPTTSKWERILWCIISTALHRSGPGFIPSDMLVYILLHLLLKFGVKPDSLSSGFCLSWCVAWGSFRWYWGIGHLCHGNHPLDRQSCLRIPSVWNLFSRKAVLRRCLLTFGSMTKSCKQKCELNSFDFHQRKLSQH